LRQKKLLTAKIAEEARRTREKPTMIFFAHSADCLALSAVEDFPPLASIGAVDGFQQLPEALRLSQRERRAKLKRRLL